jgi:heptaprenyl diphosphate synthase
MKKHIAYLGLLLTLALILSYVESLIPVFVSIPGVKLGLANLVVLICLYAYPSKYAFVISIMRVMLAGLLFGSMFSILYSLAGAFFSLMIMLLAKKVFKLGILGVSVLGGVFHNIGQLIVAILVVSNYRISYLLPYLLLSGVLTGAIIGFVANSIVPYLKKHL